MKIIAICLGIIFALFIILLLWLYFTGQLDAPAFKKYEKYKNDKKANEKRKYLDNRNLSDSASIKRDLQ